ncbi:MAG: EVE domain-containing protein [Calditrichaeota bacterium]|nr:MAG: EVE domain-containing protein [Calditrichota bacterium]
MQYWLLKSDPEVYSWEDLKRQPGGTDYWDGVRNYQARNFMRQMQVGDLAFFYHSQQKPPAIMGIVKIVRPAYPDPTQFDPSSTYFDPKSTRENPRWVAVDIQYYQEFTEPVTLPELRQTPGLEQMILLRKGSRLSVMPITEDEWRIILSLRA